MKLVHTFEIEADELYELYLDFDADRSVRQTGPNQYRLVPVIRLQAFATSGLISGSLAPANTGAHMGATVGQDTVSTYAAADGFLQVGSIARRYVQRDD